MAQVKGRHGQETLLCKLQFDGPSWVSMPNLHTEGCWFLVVENLDESDQFILGRDFVRIFDVMIDLNRIRNPDRKYVKKPINRIITDENKVPFFWIEN